jgi:hypothetical protein
VQWGYLPRDDLRGMHFPKLQKLDLGSYTFSHDWQLEWIAAHGATLQELTLDDCPIVHQMRDYGQLDSEGYAVDPASDMGPERTWKYDRRWSYYFAKIEKRLPKLKSFRYGIGPWGSQNYFEDDVLNKGVSRTGYICFNRGLGPTPWIEN